MIAASLEEVGAARSIVIDEHGLVLAGEGVTRAAQQAGIALRVVDASGAELVAVRRRGLTAVQKHRLALLDNRAAELAEWDPDVLEQLLAEGIDLGSLWTEAELHELMAARPGRKGRTDPDDIPAARRTSIRRGDLFELGSHRLLCGDSTVPDDVQRVLRDAVPRLMVTDPPYGVEYDPSWRVTAGVNQHSKKQGKVLNDDRADWTEAWRLFPGDACYVWHAGLKSSIVQASLEHASFTLRAQIIWAKDRLVLSRGDYHWQHEPCWYGVREGKRGHRTTNRSQVTVWRIATLGATEPEDARTTLWEIPARDDGGHGHGTQKPVECMARPMRNHIAPEVYEPFSGSGSTLIAGETEGRCVFAIELNPVYVQMAIDRWEAFTGQKAVKAAAAKRKASSP